MASPISGTSREDAVGLAQLEPHLAPPDDVAVTRPAPDLDEADEDARRGTLGIEDPRVRGAFRRAASPCRGGRLLDLQPRRVLGGSLCTSGEERSAGGERAGGPG